MKDTDIYNSIAIRIKELEKENKRLNNIINELEKKIYYLYNYAGLDTNNLDKELKELKGE